MDAAGVDRVLAAGAQAAQLGTALLRTEESGARQLHKERVLASPHFTRTALSQGFHRAAGPGAGQRVRPGPPGRAGGLPRRCTTSLPAARGRRRRRGCGAAENLWAGTGWQQARAASVADVLPGLLG